ncbi:MAG: hypothetical protein ABIN69_18775 [Aestuariivirga sp.]
MAETIYRGPYVWTHATDNTYDVPDWVNRAKVVKIADSLALDDSQRHDLLLFISFGARYLGQSGKGSVLVSDQAIISQLKAIAKQVSKLAEIVEKKFDKRSVIELTMDHLMKKLGGDENAKSQTHELSDWLQKSVSVAKAFSAAMNGNEEVERDLERTISGMGSSTEIYGAMLPHLWETLTGIKFSYLNSDAIEREAFVPVNGTVEKDCIRFVCDCSEAMGQTRQNAEAIVKSHQRAKKNGNFKSQISNQPSSQHEPDKI